MTHSQGHKALRKGRGSERGRIYHVTFATVNRTPWFHDPATAMAACRTFAPSIAAADAEWMCWVLMPDHFHGLLRLHGSQDLSRCVQRLKGRATVACHAALGRQAAIWARGFHDHAMRRDEDVWAAARYIVANPERAGLVADAMQYPYWNAEWL
ncbi:MAG: transposase [Proteobacteria bacterium]|nr:transposase [Pseudomonadota bacterium]